MGRLERSWGLARASWGVLQQDRELLIFPVLSGIASLMVMASFVVPALALGVFEGTGGGQVFGAVGMVGAFLFYLAQYTVIFFFNSALVGAAMIRLEGGDPTVGDGLRIAFDRIGAIVEYAALAATVGMVLKFIQERVGIFGRILGGVAGMGWTLATYLAVPVLVSQRIGPIDVVRESALLFRRTWGEQVVGKAGMGLAVGIVGFAVLLGGAGLFAGAVALGSVPLALGVACITVFGLVGVGVVGSALGGVYGAVLYRYATTGSMGGGFTPELLSGAFRPRSER